MNKLNPECLRCGILVQDGVAGIPYGGHRMHYTGNECIAALKERIKVLEKANTKWYEESIKLQNCLKEIGSDGSIYRSVFDEAIAVLRHWKTYKGGVR